MEIYCRTEWTCPKCWNQQMASSDHQRFAVRWLGAWKGEVFIEELRVECGRCGYTWYQKCKDYVEEE